MTNTPDIWMLHTTNPREGESQWGGCYIVEADAHNDAATMRKVTGLDWEVVPMVRADSLGKCLHQIAEPATVQAAPSEVMGALRALHDSVELAIQRGALSERALEIIIMQPATDVLMRAAAPQAVPGVGALDALQEAEAALELAIHRILKRDPGHAVHVTSEAKALVAVRAALDTAAHHTHQGLDDRDVFERAYAEHAIAYAGLDAHVDDVVQRVKDGRDGNSYKHLHDSGAWVGWNLALAAQAKQGEQANG